MVPLESSSAETLEKPAAAPGPDARDAAPAPRACPNCGAWVSDEYCPRCGQHNAAHVVSVRRFIRDALDDQLSVNGTLPRTLGALLFHPGRLTTEYLAGRIARYVPPLKLYLLASVVCFLVLSAVARADVLWRRVEPQVAKAERQAAERHVELKNVDLQLDTARVPGVFRPLTRRMVAGQDRLNGMTPRESLRTQVDAVESAAPRMVFLLVPVFAAILSLLHLRRRRLYAEHFIFALHFHAFAFLLAAVVLLSRAPLLYAVFPLVLLGYLLLAMRRVYGQGWLRTAASLVVLAASYGAVLVCAVVLLAIFSIATI